VNQSEVELDPTLAWRAVHPPELDSSASAPASSNICTSGRFPLAAAILSGENSLDEVLDERPRPSAVDLDVVSQ